eukprot:gene5181-6307_t
MDQRINGPTDQWTNGSMDQWINGPTDQWTNGSMDQWINGPTDQWTNGSTNQWINGPMDQQIDGSVRAASRQQAEPVKSSEREAAALKQQWDRFLRGAEEQEARRKAGEAAGGIQAAEEEADFDLAAVREQITEMIEKSTHGLDKVEYLSAFGIPVVGTDMKNLKGAYRRAAMRYHPDKNRGVGFEDRIFAEEAFKAITLKMGDLRG